MKYVISYSLLPFLIHLLGFKNVLLAQKYKNHVQFTEQRFLPAYELKKPGNTTIFQGNNKQRKYFEGWYFKMVGPGGKSILSVIPGISISEDGLKQHAFIQFINGITGQTYYYYYYYYFPIESFSFSTIESAVAIDGNYFFKR